MAPVLVDCMLPIFHAINLITTVPVILLLHLNVVVHLLWFCAKMVSLSLQVQSICSLCDIIECNDGEARLGSYETHKLNDTVAIVGPLEVCINGRWASVSDNGVAPDNNTLHAVEEACRAMGYSGMYIQLSK